VIYSGAVVSAFLGLMYLLTYRSLLIVISYNIQEWTKQNKMRLNIDKTKHMIINQTTAGPTNITITINNYNLEKVENYKYLGSILNDKLDYDEQ
jgi:hypothetical protein